MKIMMTKDCNVCRWQYSCPDCWEGNPKIPETGCVKFEKEENLKKIIL